MDSSRWLSWADDDAPAPEPARREALRVFLLVAALVEVGLTNLLDDPRRGPLNLIFPLLLLAFLGLCVSPAWRRTATAAAALTMLAINAWRLPATPNHYLITAVALFFLALTDTRQAEEQRLGLNAMRWLIVIVLVVSGLQKLSYGTYFRAEFLTFDLAINRHFAGPFALLMPAEELSRMRGLGAGLPGDGPYRTSWLPLVLLSNVTYVFEIAVPWLLLCRRTRPAALAATILFLVAVESAAREIFFGAIAVNLLLLFSRRNWNRRLLPLFLALYALLILVRLGLAPGWFFT